MCLSARCWLLASVLALFLPGLVDAQPTTTRVSVGPGGAQGHNTSWEATISADGRWVVFASFASNLVVADTNGLSDVFVHDRQTGTTSRVSVGPNGAEGNGESRGAAISADGRWVAFLSVASNLVAGDTNATTDIFVHDRQAAVTTRVSVGPGSAQANDSSGDYGPSISADGRWVTFDSRAGNLVPGDTNNAIDVFVHDQQTGTTTLASVGIGGAPGGGDSWGGAISAGGRWVAFSSTANNLVPGDTNFAADAFVFDRETGTTTRVSEGTGGTQGDGPALFPKVSADGRWVVFSSNASNLVTGDTNGVADVFLHDRQTATTARVSVGPGGTQGDGSSTGSAMSPDGRWVAFGSAASNLVAGDTNGHGDAFVYDRDTGSTVRVSVGSLGAEADGSSSGEGVSADGRWVVFSSRASNLVAGDANGAVDVFVRDRVDPACSIALAPQSVTTPATLAAGPVQVTAPPGCSWTAVSTDPSWLTVTGGSGGTGPGTVNYSAAANAALPRTARLIIWDQSVTVHQVSPTTPETPSGLVAALVTGHLVTLRWTIPPFGPTPTAFLLEGGVQAGQVLASIPTGSTAPVFTFAAPRGSFYVRVHAVSGAFRSAASNEIRIHVDTPVRPSDPANLLGLADGSTLTLAWTNTYTGGAPTTIWLRVRGPLDAWVPLGVVDHFTFAGVPPGIYTFDVTAQNTAGNSFSTNAVTLEFPSPCAGPPVAPTDVAAYRIGRTVFVTWAPGTTGAAPTGYLLNVTGSFVGAFATSERALSGAVGPGSYTLSVRAVNPCGASAASPPQTVVVP